MLQKGLDNVVPGLAGHEDTSKLTRGHLGSTPPDLNRQMSTL